MKGMARWVVCGAAALLPWAALAQMNDGSGVNNGGYSNPVNGNPVDMGPVGPAGSNTAPITSSNSMRDSLGAPGVTGQQMRDKDFLRKAVGAGLAQIQFAKLAEEKGGTEVKQFAQTALTDHTTLNQQLGSVADQLGVMVPTKMSKQDQQEYDRLNSLTGDAFDREYITLEINNHGEDLRQFRMEAMNAASPALQSEVADASRDLYRHMRMAIQLAQDKGIPVPPRPPHQHPQGNTAQK